MMEPTFITGPLDTKHQALLTAGFENYSKERSLPAYQKDRINWLVHDADGQLVGVIFSSN